MDNFNNQKRLYKGEEILMDDKWQEDYLSRLGDFVIKMLDTADNVPEFLAKNPNFAPADLLSAEERAAMLKERKNQVQSSYVSHIAGKESRGRGRGTYRGNRNGQDGRGRGRGAYGGSTNAQSGRGRPEKPKDDYGFEEVEETKRGPATFKRGGQDFSKPYQF